MYFPVSGVETSLWVPPLTAFVVSLATSMGGVSGAFLLLPFQVSVLGYTAPSVSATNQLYNIVAIPSGVYRYVREGRMVWPLTWVVIIGTMPGVFVGALVRLELLSDPRHFKLFAALVLGYVGLRLLRTSEPKPEPSEWNGGQEYMDVRDAGPLAGRLVVTRSRFSWRVVEFDFDARHYAFSPAWVFGLCFVVGLVGGVYGIGGGAIVAPFFVAVLGLPVHAVAGAALMGTFVTSLTGVVFYQLLAPFYGHLSVAPDWRLGLLLGLGGMVGMYCGASLQGRVPARSIKILLTACILFVAVKYVWEFFA